VYNTGMNGDDQQKTPAPQAPQASWQFTPEPNQQAGVAPTSPAPSSEPTVSWTASEFVAHQKNAGWYAMLVVVAVVLAAIVYLLTHDKISVAVVVIVGILFGVIAGNRPRVLTYQLDGDGITISRRLYPYGTFKSFSVIDEGAFSSIMLLPLKRFMPPISVYFAPDDQERILDVLAQHLPMSQDTHDVLDRFMSRIKF
jgi:hypothetical protein